MRVLITGACGLLGKALSAEAARQGHSTFPFRREELDITDAGAVHAALHRTRPDVVFNCAAFSNVDRAEAEPALALAVNRDGAGNVAEAAAGAGAVMVHLSTDYVFDGKQTVPYRPSDPPAPLSHYGRSKLAGERAVRESGAEHLVVRTSWLFGEGSKGFVNFVRHALGLGAASGPVRVVSDETSRPTWIGDLAPALLDLVGKGGRGFLHLANNGSCTRLELALEIRAAMSEPGAPPPPQGGFPEILPVDSGSFGAPARRPLYSVLDLTDAERVLGRPMVPWQTSLRRFLRS